MKNLLLLSNSRMPGSAYLEHAVDLIAETLGPAKSVLLIPYATVASTYDNTLENVRRALKRLNLQITGLHQCNDPVSAIEDAPAILVNGGNTYHLLHQLRHKELIAPLRRNIHSGKPYVGWSAGSAICAPSIRTSNDMPIIDPAGLDALGIFEFQLNAHYTNAVPPDWMGETRDERLAEFLALHPSMPVLGLPEGDWLRIRGNDITLGGPFPGKWFRAAAEPVAVRAGPLPSSK